MAKKKKNFQSIFQDDEYSKPGIEIVPDAKPPKLEPIPEKERRGADRYKVEFEVVMFYKGQSFRTKSINVSVTGLLLADSVPVNYVDQPVDIVLIQNFGRNKDYYFVKGKSLGAPFRSPRILFTQITDNQKKKLEALFENCELYDAVG